MFQRFGPDSVTNRRDIVTRSSTWLAAATIAIAGTFAATPAHAQDAPAVQYQQAISANPFGLLLELFNAEYERVVSDASTVGIGGSYFNRDDDVDGIETDDRYTNADVFFRYYPQGRPLDGWAFGAKVGVTKVTDSGTYFGYGFDVNRSWLLGKNQNFYVGVGVGLKKLVGGEDGDLEYIPTFRIVNIGFAF
jgi:hypothetical protein